MNIGELFSEKSFAFKEVNLNSEALEYLKEIGVISPDGIWREVNPLIHPIACEKFMRWVHKKYGVAISFGGYGEDRSTLWHDTYLDKFGAYYHLGIDLNIPAGTEIFSPVSGKVIVSDHDRDHPTAPQEHGWGNRLIIDPEEGGYLMILAHLGNIRKQVGAIIHEGEMLGAIGNSTENGGWFEHFHIQAIAREKFAEIMQAGKLAELDGYAETMDEVTRKIYPNPLEVF